MAPALSTSSGYLRGAVCIVGIYGSFLVWGFLQVTRSRHAWAALELSPLPCSALAADGAVTTLGQERITSFRSKEGVRFTFTAALNLVRSLSSSWLTQQPRKTDHRGPTCLAIAFNQVFYATAALFAAIGMALFPEDKEERAKVGMTCAPPTRGSR